MKNNPLNSVFDLLADSDNRVLIMDCEYYGPDSNTNGQRLYQVAGRIFRSNIRFNHYIYDNKVCEAKRFKFLKQTNLPYKDAIKLTPDVILKDVKDFIREYKITHLLFFDDSLDHKQLAAQSNEIGVNFFANVNVFDLSDEIATAIGDSGRKLSLQAVVMLLGISHNNSFHNARFDVEAIYKICTFYYDALNPYNQQLLLDQADITDLVDDL